MYFRIHTNDIAYLTQLPRGLFTAVGKLVEAGQTTPEETAEYWRQRQWFEAALPVPPFYADGNSIKAVTWYKDNTEGREMFAKMGFYVDLGRRYGLTLLRTTASSVPGTVVYEDQWQIGVTASRHEGDGFDTQAL